MNTKYLRRIRRIGGLILAALMLLGLTGMFSTVAGQNSTRQRVIIVRPVRPFYQPFYRPYYDPYGRFDTYSYYNQYVFRSSEAAENQGYHDGLKTGRSDAHDRRSYDPERSHYFQDAGFGNFAEAYRNGFSRGYRDGFGPA